MAILYQFIYMYIYICIRWINAAFTCLKNELENRLIVDADKMRDSILLRCYIYYNASDR